VAGLLALLVLTESRRASRTRPDGALVLLGEQDRTRWDRALIQEGQAILRRCLRRNQPGTYQLQGPAAALALVDELDLDTYHPFHATRADLLRQLGRHREAAAAYQRAAALAPTDAERDFLRLGGRASR